MKPEVSTTWQVCPRMTQSVNKWRRWRWDKCALWSPQAFHMHTHTPLKTAQIQKLQLPEKSALCNEGANNVWPSCLWACKKQKTKKKKAGVCPLRCFLLSHIAVKCVLYKLPTQQHQQEKDFYHPSDLHTTTHKRICEKCAVWSVMHSRSHTPGCWKYAAANHHVSFSTALLNRGYSGVYCNLNRLLNVSSVPRAVTQLSP